MSKRKAIGKLYYAEGVSKICDFGKLASYIGYLDADVDRLRQLTEEIVNCVHETVTAVETNLATKKERYKFSHMDSMNELLECLQDIESLIEKVYGDEQIGLIHNFSTDAETVQSIRDFL